MLCDEPIIDEELEALLYAQVYYGKQEDTEEPKLTEIPTETKSLTETEPDGKEANQVEETSDTTNPYKFLITKYPYFEHNFNKEELKGDTNKDIFNSETSKASSEENKHSETDNSLPRLESNILIDHLDKTVQEQTLPIQTLVAERTESPQQFIQISTSANTTPTQNNFTQVLTNASSPINKPENQVNQPTTLHNNITINQYLFPPTFVQRLKSSVENRPLSKRCQQDLRRLKKGSISEQEFFNNLKRRLKVQKKQQQNIRKILQSKQRKVASSEIISLSDSDNSDIEFVGVTINMESGKKDSVDDDEIIYVAPPPVPVINVDSESDTETSDKPKESPENSFLSSTLQDSANIITLGKSTGSQICNEEDEASNDFLQSENTSDNFNFSLHGSDFQESEFVRPANPTEAYETESSTSTSDFNRDSTRQFCNTVKTIVFSEVDFPQQDMFNDNNLETFGEFITPKRKDNIKIPDITECSADTVGISKGNKRINPRTSSESSSESEYGDTNTHQNLPELTPMVCAENSPKKGSSKKKQFGTPKKKKSKFSSGNHGILDESYNSVDEPIRKRKSCESADIDGQTAKKKSKKKKHKSDVQNSKVNEEGINITEVLDEPKKKSKKKKKQGNIANIQPQILDESEDVVNDSNKKKAKKKKGKEAENENAVDNQEHVTEEANKQNILEKGGNNANIQPQTLDESENVANDCNKKKAKKKKGKEAAEKSFDVENALDNQGHEIEEANEQNMLEKGGNKKNKKRKQKESLEARFDIDKSTKTTDENQVSSTTEKGTESQNINICFTNQDNVGGQRTGNELEDNKSRKKSKKKKRGSTDKRSSVDEANLSNNEKDAEKDKETSLAVHNLESCSGKEMEGKTNFNESLTEQESSMLEKDSITENNRKKNKRKKQLSSERRISGDELNKPSEETQIVKNIEEEVVSRPDKESTGEKSLEVQKQDDDIILIEQAIPIHTIESSSDSDDDDILSLTNVGKDLELANISVMEGNVENENQISREFDIDHIQSKMSDDPDKWKIMPADRYNLNVAKRGPRCNKCRQLGHISISCPNKPSDPSCTLCGEPGHQEPRCPNKVCFSCGQPGSYSTVFCYKCARDRNNRCNLCYLIGHKSDYCPDLWRRYFLTTTAGPIQGPKKSPMIKPRNKQWCSGCASSGHLEYECNTYKWIREYPVSSPNIFRYHNVYPVSHKPRENKKTPSKVRPVVRAGTPRQHIRYHVDSATTSTAEPTPQNNTINSGETSEQTQLVDNSQCSLPSAADNQECPNALQQPGTEMENEQTANIVQNPAPTPAETQENETAEVNTEMPPPNDVQQAQPEVFNAIPQTSTKNNKNALIQAKKKRQKERKKASRNPRINPLSMMRQPINYTPYQSVLNPYSLAQGPPSRGLFNPVPFDILNQQLSNYARRFPNYADDGGLFNQNPQNFYISPQFNPQIEVHPEPPIHPPGDAYQQFSGQYNPEPYYNFQESGNVYASGHFSDLPYTITAKPSEVNEEFHVNKTRYNLRDREALARKREAWEQELVAWGREYAANFASTRTLGEQREVFDKSKFEGREDVREAPNMSRNSSRDFIYWERAGEPQKRYYEHFYHGDSNMFQNENDLKQQSTSRNSSIDYLQGESTVPQGSNIEFIPPTRNRQKNHPKCKQQVYIPVDEDARAKFKSSDCKVLQKIIRQELTKLKSLKQSDARPFKQRLNSIDRVNKRDVKNRPPSEKVMFLLYKKINMFLFGVHKLGNGKRKLECLQSFAYNSNQTRLNEKKRKELLSAYRYIFGGEHSDFNYKHNLNALIVNCKK